MLASFIMSLRSEGVACGAGVRQGGSSRRRGRRRRVARLAVNAARKTTATRLYAHVREKCDELRLENDALGVRVHDAKLVDGAQMRFGRLLLLLLFEQLSQNKLRQLQKRIKRRRQRRAGVGHVADQRQRDGIAVHVRPSTRHSVPQFAHEQRGLICREEAVGVVVVEAEYAFDLRLALRERSQGDAQLSKRLLFLTFPQRRPVAHCGRKKPICLRLQRSHQWLVSQKARHPAFAAHCEAGSSALPPPTPPRFTPPACSAPTSDTLHRKGSILNRERL